MRSLLREAGGHAGLLALLLAAMTPLTAAFSYLDRHNQIDDALIYHRYIRNALTGNGLTYNPGEFFNALTSPLYTYLTIGVSCLTRDVQGATIVLSGTCLLGAVAVFAAVFARAATPLAALCGAVLMGGSRFFYFTYGLETTLFVLLIGVCLLAFERGDDSKLGIAAALLLLTRGEGIFLLLALALEHRRQKRPRPPARCFALPGLLLASQALFNFAYYGSPLPSTAAAKLHQGRSGLWSAFGFENLGYHLPVFFSGEAALLASVAALAACGVVRLWGTALNRTALVFLALYCGFYLVSRIPNYHWYYGPIYAFGFFYAGAGASWLLECSTAIGARGFRIAATAAAALLILFALGRSLAITPGDLSRAGPIPEYRELGLWLQRNTDPSASVAAVEIGTLGWYSRRPIVDILGLVSPKNARFVGEGRLGAWLDHYAPDYIVVHEPPWPHERGVATAVARGDYIRDERWRHRLLRLYRRRDA